MILLADEAATLAAGRALARELRVGDVVTLSGPLGAGKTTFARGLLQELGLMGEAASPSFAIVIPYRPPELRFPVAHADLYRVEDPAELEELGLDEFAAEGALLIEWPERLGPEGWPDALRLRIEPAGGGRRLTAETPRPWSSRWPPS